MTEQTKTANLLTEKEKIKTEKQDKLSWDEYHLIVNDALREENQSCSTCE